MSRYEFEPNRLAETMFNAVAGIAYRGEDPVQLIQEAIGVENWYEFGRPQTAFRSGATEHEVRINSLLGYPSIGTMRKI